MTEQATTTTLTQWTGEQVLGITTVGHSLLVSAAAGSGKTAVLAERCAHLVCSAEPPCDVDELLVVTFTRAAAAEMRSRIEATLRKRLDASTEDENGRLARQVALLDRASIGTLHSFCTSILREHFHLIDLDPAFTLIDEDEAKLLRLETARALFADRYDAEDAGAFAAFIDQYADGRDEALIQRVISVHNLLASMVDPDAWRKAAIDRIVEASSGTLAQSKLGRALVDQVRDRLADLQSRCIAAVESFQSEPGLDPYSEQVNELQATVQWWIECFGKGSFDKLADAVRNVEIPRLPNIPGATPGKDAAKDAIDAIKEQMKPDGALGSLCQFSETEWKDGLERTIAPTTIFLSLVEEFAQRFDAAKRTLRSIDYSDLERLALRVLSDGNRPSAVARRYHNRFKHVLVDEYQDINEVQDRILALVSRESVLKPSALGGNLFCVGDIKQSIYRFRLAQPRQFALRAKRFGRGTPAHGGQIIDLRTNFRSRAPLLECLNGLFERLMTHPPMEITYDESHRLRPPDSSPYDAAPCDGPLVALHLLPPPAANVAAADADQAVDEDRTQREAGFIAGEIKKLIDAPTRILDKIDGEPASRPARFGDIAILLRSMRFKADAFALALRTAGIPVHSDSTTGFFDSMEVRDVLSLLAVLDNQQQDIPLAAILRSPLLALPHPDDTLARARLAYPDRAVPFHTAIAGYALQTDGEFSADLRAALDQLAAWRDLINKRPLGEALWIIYTQSRYLAFCSGLADGEQCVANLLKLHERARQFDGSGQRQGLARFLLFLESLREESDLGQPSIAVEGENAVRIMSIHRAKGLEFPIVFVPDLGKKHNFQSCAGTILVDRNAYVGLSVIDEEKRARYPSLAHAIAKESIRRQTLAEELRVLYVAGTRARERLSLVGTAKPTAAVEWHREYANHKGALAPGTLLGSQTPLDWLGPAATALAAENPNLISIISHDENDLIARQQTLRPKRSAFQEQLGNLAPLNPTPPMNPKAAEILHRLDRNYRFAAFSHIPAAKSVSQLARESEEMHDIAGGTTPPPTTPGRSVLASPRIQPHDRLATPRSLSPDQPLAATEIGDATHILLEHLDLLGDAGVGDLELQRQKMVEKRLLTAAAANSIDLAGIAWFMSSPLGQWMRDHAGKVLKELPVFFPLQPDAPATTDPRDRTMIRGRIDVLIPLPDRCILIDYKTDRIAAEAVDAQVEHHRAQISLYSRALESVLNLPVEGYLAFLSVREWREVK